MRSLSPDLAQALSLVAHALGDLWTLHARLAAAAAASPGLPAASPDPEAGSELHALVEVALQVADELARLRDRLTPLTPAPPVPGAEADDPEPDLPLELLHAGIQCVLVDHLAPAIDALAGLGSEDSSLDLARVALACILADRLLPAIDGLSLVLLVHEEGSARAYLR